MKYFYLLCTALCLTVSVTSADTLTVNTKKNFSNLVLGGNPAKISVAYDQISSSKSNVEFEITNYGIFGYNKISGISGLSWPRNSKYSYIYGSGFWFGALKNVNGTPAKLCALSYNPNTGNSFFQPSILASAPDSESLYQTRVFRSTDFNPDGTPIKIDFASNWLIWNTKSSATLFSDGYTGNLVADPLQRNSAVYPKGAAFISDEDFVTVFDDQDLNRYDGGTDLRKTQGYPLNIRVMERVYSWSEEFLKDVVIIEQKVINIGNDTLLNCAMAPVFDFDFGTNLNNGYYHDNYRYLSEDTTLKLSVMWTNTTTQEKSNGFGYMGIGFLRTPAIDNLGYLLPNNDRRNRSEQIGLKTIRSWTIDNDPRTNDEFYNLITGNTIDSMLTQGGDKRFLAVYQKV